MLNNMDLLVCLRKENVQMIFFLVHEYNVFNVIFMYLLTGSI